MSLKSNHFLTGFFSLLIKCIKMRSAVHEQKFFSILLFFGLTLVFSTSFTGAAMASDSQDNAKYDNIDARWLPWLGSWRLVSNRVNADESSLKKEYSLTITPGSKADSVIMKGNQDDKVLVEEEIIADGLRHPLKDEKCPGYYVYSWSETGKRLLFNSESNCPGDTHRRISGMSIIDENRDWLDIQLLQSGGEKAVSIRKYRNIDNASVTSGRFNPDKITISRIAAGRNFSIDEIIELSSKVEPEVIEAALLELREPFPINSRELVRLSDSGVNPRIVDLMVAFTFPGKFKVEQEKISLARVTGPRGFYPYYMWPYNYYSYYCPILPWHWSPSCYMSYAYGYSYLGWYLPDGRYYPLWSWPPWYYQGGGGGGAARGGGVLVRGRGYSVAPDNSGSSSRHAVPRYAPSAKSAPVRSSSSSSSSGTSSSYSGGASSAASGGSVTTSSGGGAASASPNGYSRGH